MREGTPLPGHSHPLLPRLAADLGHAARRPCSPWCSALVISTLAAVFLTEFAPARVRRALDPVIRLLAGVPSVIYGLIGILALAPWINEHLISNSRKQSVIYVVQLNGANLTTATLILTVMILPIMVAIIANALAAVPALLARGLGGARRQPLAHDLARLAAHRAARRSPRRPCSPPRARSARR